MPAAAANADGWLGMSSKSNASKSSSATATAKDKSSSWTAWWPWSTSQTKTSSKSKAQAKPKSSSPSMFSQMQQSTKQAWNKTADFLNPFDDKPATKTKPKDKSSSGGWFSKSEPKGPPLSVPDWLAGEMPSY
jgi:hypothetical protein